MAKCGMKCEVYSRVVGYYRPVNHWNAGKAAEFKARKPFRIADAADADLDRDRWDTEGEIASLFEAIRR